MTAKSLTGRWLGRYDYPYGAASVAFEADVVEDAGVLGGAIFEPNTFRRDAGPELVADIQGSRDGAQVMFHKRYRGATPAEWPHYEGVVNGALTRIEGRWVFAATGFSGRFVMMRKPVASTAVLREAEAVV
ncbi:MAG: hypothetical protein ACRC6I_07120 [Paracoccaceae bacterium]